MPKNTTRKNNAKAGILEDTQVTVSDLAIDSQATVSDLAIENRAMTSCLQNENPSDEPIA